MARDPRTDAVQNHLDAYPYQDGDTTETSGLIVHMRDEHPDDHTCWIIGPGGGLLSWHYAAHGRDLDEMVATAVARHPAGKKRRT